MTYDYSAKEDLSIYNSGRFDTIAKTCFTYVSTHNELCDYLDSFVRIPHPLKTLFFGNYLISRQENVLVREFKLFQILTYLKYYNIIKEQILNHNEVSHNFLKIMLFTYIY